MLEVSFNADTDTCGTLFLDRRRMRSLTTVVPSAISITRWFQPERDRIEAFIESIYARSHQAHMTRHYPTLMNVHDQQGNIAAAVGLRLAGDEPLFLEQYLDQPIEAVVSATTGSIVRRDEIVEIGNLASVGRGASAYLIVSLAAYLRQQNLAYAVGTATKVLQRLFAARGIEFFDLGAAHAHALSENGVSWGTYYSCDSKILVGAISPACARLAPYLPPECNGDLKRLFSRVHGATVGAIQ